MARVTDPAAFAARTNRFLIHCHVVRRLLTKQDMDYWSATTGKEGSGKSTLSIWRSIYTDPSFARQFLWSVEHNVPSRICWDAESFMAAVERGKPGQCVVLDEAGEAWFNLEFASQVQRALSKMAQGIRERNLNVILNAPWMRYLGRVARNRLSDWAYVYMLAGERGFMELAEPSRGKFDVKHAEPYWETILHHRFLPLPPRIEEPYRRLKREAGAERLARYREEVHRVEATPPTFKARVDVLLRKIAGMPPDLRAGLRNRRGSYDGVLIMSEIERTTAREAQAAAMRLNARDRGEPTPDDDEGSDTEGDES